ncbi:MAG: AAA family ATPase [Bacteroidales bacterium]|nr:AAA family ATPase [Bacteroidales bacterium]MBS3777081.1 AAA family ATPase [Bacteroidales bacterium]
MGHSHKRYIITGGSGSGKTTLLNKLSEYGYKCFPEVSRVVIREQQQTGGDLLPWNNLEGFAEACFQRMKSQLEPVHRTNSFYDRGIPDIIAYLLNSNHPVPGYLWEYGRYYNPTVFICPPWKEIFRNDPQRPESFEESVEIYHYLNQVYLYLGCRLVRVPKIPVNERVRFIISKIDELESITG